MPRSPTTCSAALALALLTLTTSATAQDVDRATWRDMATPVDRARIDGAPKALARVLPDAVAASEPDARAALSAAIDTPAQPFEATDLVGDWRCRTIKVGGIGGGITAYSWFACRVEPEEGALWFEKLTGSQRTSGAIHDDAPDRMILLGALHYHDEGPQPHSGPDGADPDLRNMVGIVTMRAAAALIEFPAPHHESDVDFLHMVRP